MDVTIQELLASYQTRLLQLEEGIAHARFHNIAIAAVFAVSTAIFLMVSVSALRQQASLVWPSLSFPVAAISAQRYRRLRESKNRMTRLKSFYHRAAQRVQGLWVRTGSTGDEFLEAGHPYAEDLNVFGDGSLFQLLSTVRTANGQRGLAEYLLRTPALPETLRRQEAIRELRDRVDLREKIALLGDFEFSQSKWETFSNWLQSPVHAFSRVLRVAAVISSAMLASMLLAMYLTHIFPLPLVLACAVPFLAFQSAVAP